METASPGAGITLTDLAWVWLVGMAAVLGWAAASYLRLRRQVAASIRVGKQVYLCDDISSPFILGIFRPRVYLPSGLEGETLQSVLRHEGAHLAPPGPLVEAAGPSAGGGILVPPPDLGGVCPAVPGH